MRSRRHKRSAVAGFTLIEALAATVLMGMILTALGAVTAQWRSDDPTQWKIQTLRGQLFELGSAIPQLNQSDLFSRGRSWKTWRGR